MDNKNLKKINCRKKSLKDYVQFTPKVIEEIWQIAKSLAGLRIAHVNATAVGGGVAEMLYSRIGLERDIGFDSNWYVIPPEQEFFRITKKIHNFLQGKEGELSDEEKVVYLKYNQYLSCLISQINPKPDILIIHDPQPAASVALMGAKRPSICIWRCHVDTSSPNKSAWDFLKPYIASYDHSIFTDKGYVHDNFPPPDLVSFITPVIDPLSLKNQLISKNEAKKYLKRMGINIDKPLITQISRFDPWKDPMGVLKAYRLAKKEIPQLQLAFVVQFASDDPEGEIIYRKVKENIKEDKDIFIFLNLKDNDNAVRAFQIASDIMVQKSTREGFGMTVTEAMWKRATVIAGNVGGIKLQIKDNINGFLINDSREAAQKIIYLIKNPEIRKKIGETAHISVNNNFLMPHLLLRWLNLFNDLIDKKRDSKNLHMRISIKSKNDIF